MTPVVDDYPEPSALKNLYRELQVLREHVEGGKKLRRGLNLD